MNRCDESSRPETVTCLSAENHDFDIKDYMLHFLGCLEIWEKEAFFTNDNPLWREEIKHQKTLGNSAKKAEDIVNAKQQSWKSNCESELRRIDFLRKTLARDEDDKHLVEQLEKSLASWRSSTSYKGNIKAVRDWRERQGKNKSRSADVEINIKDIGIYEPEKHVNIPIIQFKNGAGINFDTTDGRVWNTFPNQKTTLGKLLNDDGSLLRKDNCSSHLRYFHIPSNNMIWAERAIGRYFDDERPDYHATYRELIQKKKTSTYMILREPYWRGQLHRDQEQSPPHARHLRPLCTIISSDPKKIDHFPTNMVLFMPYLHWETSRKREQFAMEIESIMDSAKSFASEYEQVRRKERQKNREVLHQDPPKDIKKSARLSIREIFRKGPDFRRNKIPQADDTPRFVPASSGQLRSKIMTMTRLLQELRLFKTKLQIDSRRRVEVRNPLGQFLLDAARLYEGMSNYHDKKLLRKYLYADPPLHPRRTLDQSRYWALNSTRIRDRDQVIYRSTTPDNFHTYDCISDRYDIWEWTKHKELGIEGPCNVCKANIRKLSRVIMVDQLWMWILDANTIITCFPKRYGAREQDSSSIHKAIKTRLQDDSRTAIRTVFDLALIIIEECSNSCFDQTKSADLQPQVLDSFSVAISTIMYEQTAAFERLWRWTYEASDIIKFKENPDRLNLHVWLLDIKPEGQLSREIKDIIDELDIIIQTAKTHRSILTTFITNAETILDPLGLFGNSQKRRMAGEARFGKPTNLLDEIPKSGDDKQKSKDDYTWFKLNADERLGVIQARIDELEELRVSAVDTAENVKSLLELKQQQASVVQAWQGVEQSKESFRQGRSIMMFTIVTIIFLPLSFISSIFGMNNIEMSGGTWPIKDEFLYMFPISAGVIFLSLFLAFGGFIWRYLGTLFVVKSGLYNLWLDITIPTQKVLNTSEYSERLRNNAKSARFQKMRREQALKEKTKAGRERIKAERERRDRGQV